MSNLDPRHPERVRTIIDRSISGINALRFSLTEPVGLRIARVHYERHYADPSEEPLISITIPTYDRGKLIVDRTLPSIYAQTYQNFEVVLVGDHSPDSTVQLLTQVADPRVRFINLSKRGQYPNDIRLRWFVAGVPPVNVALKLARGKWIAFLDDDDVFTPDHLAVLLDTAQRGNYEFVSGAYMAQRDGHDVVVKPQADNGWIGGHQTWLYRSYLRFIQYNIHSWRKAWNRPADIDRQMRLRAAGVRMGYTEQVVTRVLPRPGLTTTGLAAHQAEGL